MQFRQFSAAQFSFVELNLTISEIADAVCLRAKLLARSAVKTRARFDWNCNYEEDECSHSLALSFIYFFPLHQFILFCLSVRGCVACWGTSHSSLSLTSTITSSTDQLDGHYQWQAVLCNAFFHSFNSAHLFLFSFSSSWSNLDVCFAAGQWIIARALYLCLLAIVPVMANNCLEEYSIEEDRDAAAAPPFFIVYLLAAAAPVTQWWLCTHWIVIQCEHLFSLLLLPFNVATFFRRGI